MTLTAVGFVPGAPLLVPAVAGAAAGDDEELRLASRQVIASLAATGPDVIAVWARGDGSGYPADAAWTVHGFGVGSLPAGPVLPWPLGAGGWLLDDAGWTGDREYVTVPASGHRMPTAGGTGTGSRRVAVLAVGDGSACRSERAPGHLDPRAAGFDAGVAAALAHGDPEPLAGIDGELAEQLQCGGWPVWRAVGRLVGPRPVETAELLHDAAPYGVGYLVACWQLGSG